ncbi:hypothetical protein PFICI_07842 [Pestalotiopsis fici W106-1]|uniref:Uncharacterized protein n=1 Tax=Pestalotiopsis fici (strain W106-1 / CGMCC3.15140) TaxID=1229662 RepID=W3X2F3_PESFW|nr:uncharacterized protein PFICI_07842 [Pestalotiopsis fici W106-1]ETS80313.1 hypothetical protein PFICI_07842 [Pestalotiopsis fici W106-1]
MAPHKESQLSRYLARAIHGANLSKPKALTAALKDHTFTQSYRFGNPANNNFAAFKSLGTAAREKAVNWAKNRRAKVTTHFASPFSALPCLRDLLEYNHGQYFFDVDIHGNYTKTPPRHWQTLTAPLFNHAVHAMLGEPATTMNTILLAAIVRPKGHIVFLLPNSEGLEHVIRQILDHGLPLRLLSAKEVDLEPSLHGGRHQTVEIHSRLTSHSKQKLTNIYDSFWRERMMHSSAADAQITIARSAAMKDWGSHFIATFRRLPNAGPADSTVGLLNLYETLYGFPQKDSHERPVSDQDVDDAKDQDDDDDGALRTALERTQSFTAASDPSSIDVDALKGEIARLENVISKMQTKMAKTPE